MKILQIPIDELKPNDNNPRRIKKSELKGLVRSITEFGFQEPVIVNQHPGRENVIVGGCQRVRAVTELKGKLDNRISALETDLISADDEQKKGIKVLISNLTNINKGKVPVTYVDLPKDKEETFNIALNKISGDWDDDKLFELLKGLDDNDADLTLTGFDDRELFKLLKKEAEEEKILVSSHERKQKQTKFLTFAKIDEDEYSITNEKQENLGSIKHLRVGTWMSWCLTDVKDSNIYFSAGCLDEIRDKIKSLNSQ